jgi:hypothetical protein
VQHAERAGDGIHACIRQRNRLGVTHPELDTRVASGRLGNHIRGEIYPDDLGTAPGRLGGERAGAAGDVEETHAGYGPNGVKQWIDGPQGNGTEGIVPVTCLAVPAFKLCVAEALLCHLLLPLPALLKAGLLRDGQWVGPAPASIG